MSKAVLFTLACILVAFSALNATPAKADVFYGTVIPSSLNVRERPTTNSSVIQQLSKNEKVIVTVWNDDWLMVLAEGKLGYVAAKFVDIDTTQPLVIQGDEDCSTDILSTSIDSRAVDFYCDESILNGGFNSCTVEVSVSAESTCSKDAEVYVSCDAVFNYRTQNGYISQMDTSSTTANFWVEGGTGYRSMYIEWSPFTVLDIVTKVGVDSVQCTLTDVFQY